MRRTRCLWFFAVILLLFTACQSSDAEPYGSWNKDLNSTLFTSNSDEITVVANASYNTDVESFRNEIEFYTTVKPEEVEQQLSGSPNMCWIKYSVSVTANDARQFAAGIVFNEFSNYYGSNPMANTKVSSFDLSTASSLISPESGIAVLFSRPVVSGTTCRVSAYVYAQQDKQVVFGISKIPPNSMDFFTLPELPADGVLCWTINSEKGESSV